MHANDHPVADAPGRGTQRAIKRGFDIAAAGLGLLLLSPLLLLVGLAVRCRLGSPVLFIQERPGLGGWPFRLLKFRTMTDERDESGKLLPGMRRTTPLGRFLRASSLDELPSLWNVLIGDMSLIGPRPLLMEYLPLYTSEQRRRHEVRPGITGWAQVNGRNALTWEEKFRLDVWYVDNQSFPLDLRILWMTLGKVARREGINASNDVTMKRFTGTQPDG